MISPASSSSATATCRSPPPTAITSKRQETIESAATNIETPTRRAPRCPRQHRTRDAHTRQHAPQPAHAHPTHTAHRPPAPRTAHTRARARRARPTASPPPPPRPAVVRTIQDLQRTTGPLQRPKHRASRRPRRHPATLTFDGHTMHPSSTDCLAPPTSIFLEPEPSSQVGRPSRPPPLVASHQPPHPTRPSHPISHLHPSPRSARRGVLGLEHGRRVLRRIPV